jgi:pimeloyl-ACP methyl ester carboxylesterase
VWFHPVTDHGAALAVLDLPSASGPPDDGVGTTATVYLGGLGSASTVAFAPVVGHPALAGKQRQVVVDLFGSGWSDHDDDFSHTIEAHADAVAAVLDGLGLRGTRLVGHSLGGSVAIVLAAARPELVAHLVVAEPNLDPGIGTFSRLVSAFTEDEFAGTEHARLVAGLLRDAADGDPNAAQFARTLRRWSGRGLHRTAVSLLADRRPTFRDQLTALRCPRTYVSGELTRERLGPLRAAGLDVRVVPAAGHVLMHDNLDGFVAAITPNAVTPA